MAKRSAGHLEELEGPVNKKVDWKQPTTDSAEPPVAPPLRELDFSGLSPELVRLVGEAVTAALQPGSKQPVILDVIEGDRSEGIAYWPKSYELGVWLLQALAHLKLTDIATHREFVASLAGCLDAPDVETVFQGYCNNAINCPQDLGRFCGVIDLDEEAEMVPEEAEHFVTRASLSTHLYHQQCYLEVATCCSEEEEEEEDDESEGEEVVQCEPTETGGADLHGVATDRI